MTEPDTTEKVFADLRYCIQKRAKTGAYWNLIELQNRWEALEAENAALLQANRDCNAWFDALNSDHQKALKTLDELARLGNEPHYGNSIGNVIAQRCLNSLID